MDNPALQSPTLMLSNAIRMLLPVALRYHTLLSLTLPSGGDDQVVKFWEVCTGRCLKTLQCGGTVHSMAWNPNPSLTLLAIAV